MASQYRQAKAGLEQVQKSYDRVKALADEGGVAQDVVDQVETGLKVARANFDAVNKMVHIQAPFNGTVVAVNVKVNDQVSPGGGGPDAPPPPIVLARLDRVQVELAINEASINHYRKNQPSFVCAGADTVRGKVTDIAISGNKQNHSFPVTVDFKNRGHTLKPGMYATVYTAVYRNRQALKVPLVAVKSGEKGRFVFVVNINQAS